MAWRTTAVQALECIRQILWTEELRWAEQRTRRRPLLVERRLQRLRAGVDHVLLVLTEVAEFSPGLLAALLQQQNVTVSAVCRPISDLWLRHSLRRHFRDLCASGLTALGTESSDSLGSENTGRDSGSGSFT